MSNEAYIYDAIRNMQTHFNIQTRHVATQTNGELGIVFYFLNDPPQVLTTGPVAEVRFDIKPDCIQLDGNPRYADFNFATTPAPGFADAFTINTHLLHCLEE